MDEEYLVKMFRAFEEEMEAILSQSKLEVKD